jgi:hypothetical protein
MAVVLQRVPSYTVKTINGKVITFTKGKMVKDKDLSPDIIDALRYSGQFLYFPENDSAVVKKEYKNKDKTSEVSENESKVK